MRCVEPELSLDVHLRARTTHLGARDGGQSIGQSRLHRDRIDRHRVHPRRAEREVEVARHRRRLEAASARRAAAGEIGARSIHHHAAEVEPRRIHDYVVAQLLRLEVHRPAQAERRVTRQGEPGVDPQCVDRTARAERSRRVAHQGQRGRELPQLGQRHGASDEVHVHRLPTGRVYGDATDGARPVGSVLMHDVDVRHDELSIARPVERRRSRQRAADRQGGEQQLRDVDLHRRHPHVQISRAHHDWRARHAQHTVGDHPARPAVIGRERDVGVEIEPLRRAVELRTPNEHTLARRLDRGRDLLDQPGGQSTEPQIGVVEDEGVGHRDAEVAQDVCAAGAHVGAAHHVVLRRAAPLDEHRCRAAAVLRHVRVQPPKIVERRGLGRGGQPHVAVLDHVHAVPAHLRVRHVDANALPPQRIVGEPEPSNHCRQLGRRRTERQRLHAQLGHVEEANLRARVGELQQREPSGELPKLDDLHVATRHLHDHQPGFAGERFVDETVARASRDPGARRPRRPHGEVSLDDARVVEPDPRAESGQGVAGRRLRRGPETPVVPVLLARQLLDHDIRTVDHEIRDRDPLPQQAAERVAARERIRLEEGMARAIGDRDAGDRCAGEQVASNGAQLHDAVRRLRQRAQGEPPHPLPAVIRVGHHPHDDEREGEERQQHDQQAGDALEHQYA